MIISKKAKKEQEEQILKDAGLHWSQQRQGEPAKLSITVTVLRLSDAYPYPWDEKWIPCNAANYEKELVVYKKSKKMDATHYIEIGIWKDARVDILAGWYLFKKGYWAVLGGAN